LLGWIIFYRGRCGLRIDIAISTCWFW